MLYYIWVEVVIALFGAFIYEDILYNSHNVLIHIIMSKYPIWNSGTKKPPPILLPLCSAPYCRHLARGAYWP
jgi:hypothetical protein